MRVPFTKYGFPQLILYPLVTLILMALLFSLFKPALWLFPVETVLFLVFLWMLSFFRDPPRRITRDETVLLSPADGIITDISPSDDSVLGGKAMRIGIFLSVFNVHINRAPCSVRVERICYKKGRFRNAFSPESGKVNESNDILMVRLSEPKETLLVRQISGAIARHIVCEAKEADEYSQGEAFGMIKFGSRTELYLPIHEQDHFEVSVKVGDKAAAGLTPLVRYRS